MNPAFNLLKKEAQLALANRRRKKTFLDTFEYCPSTQQLAREAWRSAWNDRHPSTHALTAARKRNWLLAQLKCMQSVCENNMGITDLMDYWLQQIHQNAHRGILEIKRSFPNRKTLKKQKYAQTNP